MVKIFIISDTHFFHGNIIKYCNRPFKGYHEMNERMIEEWNRVVSKEDIVIHLGDFAFRDKAKLVRDKLNGSIVLIRGNHDKNLEERDGFIIIEGNLIVNNFIFSHKPLKEKEIPNGMVNVFGHIHHQLAYSGVCVCVEKINYSPIELNKLVSFVE